MTAVLIPAGGYADWPCPDCDAEPGCLCHWWCPRYADVLYDDEEEEVPDGF
jgi:hypothetical protein